MESAIICLADNQKFNFSKFIFDNMVRSLEGGVKFYLFLRFLQVFLDKQVEGMEDASKQGRMVEEIDQNAKITLDDETQGRTNDDEMIRVDDLAGKEIIEDVSTAEPVTTIGEVVTTTTIKDSVAPTTDVTEDEITMAQALTALKSIKPKVVQSQIPTVSSSKDKGKVKMIEPEVPIKKKDQMRIDEEYARKLEAEEQEAARLSRAQQDEEANNSWDNIQAMMDTDRLLGRSFDEIKKLLDREIRKVNDFIAMDSEAQESSKKRTAEHLESDISKKQKVDENIEPVIDDSEELKKCMQIVHDDGDEIIRADGNSQVYQTFEKMFKNFNREDLEVLWAIVKDRFKKEKPMNDMDNLLFRTLKTMFEHHVEDNIWKYQQRLAK
nr:hypothetical protein [Tanacetum cinerariifolium]